MAVGETRSSPLPQPINYGHTGDKKGKIFLLTLYITCLVWYYECLFCYESKERRERKEQNFGCMSESRKNLRFVHLLTSPCLSIKYWTFSMEKNFFPFSQACALFSGAFTFACWILESPRLQRKRKHIMIISPF